MGKAVRACVDTAVQTGDMTVKMGDFLKDAGFGAITTEVRSAEEAGVFFYAEEYHQQYLAKNPNGYCNHGFCQIPYTAPDTAKDTA